MAAIVIPNRTSNSLRSLGFAQKRQDTENLVYELLGSSLILAEDWEQLSADERDRLMQQPDNDRALLQMVDCGLLTHFQAARISTGNTFGLVLGNFRILERLGAGGMAVVYKAEHIEMRHCVAIKVLQVSRDDDPRLEARFSAEMRAIARLRHPNIVAAMDAGRVYNHDPDGPVLWYLVMEFVPGETLDEHVRNNGPMSVLRACNLVHQVASALAETHKLKLVHRDIKPLNILITPEEQAKLLDFGLSRHIPTKMTQAGTVLGTIDFMAPEQAEDASTVDIRADIYGLGGTLFWCLTGQLPFSAEGTEIQILLRRLVQQPPSARAVMPSLPRGIDKLLERMMALRPEDRFGSPEELMRALVPFLRPDTGFQLAPLYSTDSVLLEPPEAHAVSVAPASRRILIIDDEFGIRLLCREVLRIDGLECEEADSAEAGLERAIAHPPDLVLLDINLPGMGGPELLRLLRSNPPTANLKVIMISGQSTADEMAQMLRGGADDYLSKPFSIPQLLGRVNSALRLKEAQDRAERLRQNLLGANRQLENSLENRTSDLSELRTALVLALAGLSRLRDGDAGRHLDRMARYARHLGESAGKMPCFAEQIDQAFVDMLACCSPLHDIGKVGLPDHILLKPGKLSEEERLQMQAHTTLGADMLAGLIEKHPAARAFLDMAADIIRHHHERFDGTGYPDRLAGHAIPLAARVAAICDVYDALRCRRSYKPALSHQAASQVLLETTPGQFDPALLEAFRASAGAFEQVYREMPG
jgi:response regulator RpfG family c-di-GMP phosphodiesterase/serine/threonine protein kinase